MNGWLLDTNVVSELTKSSPDKSVVSFLSARNELWLSTVVLHELEFGVQCLSLGRRRTRLHEALAVLSALFEDRILAVERTEAEWAARLRAVAHRSGRVLHLGDALIAGTARAHELAVATRNVSDFEGIGVKILTPWTEDAV